MTHSYTPEIPAILNQWGLKALEWEKVKDVYQVQTDDGLKNLKLSPLNPKRLRFVHQVINHLSTNGFTKLCPLIPTQNGANYYHDQHYAYTLFDWIPGRQCNIKDQSELVGATKLLAEFHLRSAGFKVPPDSHPRLQLGKCPVHFARHHQELLEFKSLARSRPNDAIAQLYLEHVEFFLPFASQAILSLKASRYWDLVARARVEHPFCHGDPAARNFILTPGAEIWMIDFDSCRIDLPLMDLIKFCRRVMKKYNWRLEIAKALFGAYHSVNPLSSDELEVIKAVLCFPQKFWRLAVRHFHQHQRYTPERTLEKLRKYLDDQATFAKFQTDFNSFDLIRES